MRIRIRFKEDYRIYAREDGEVFRFNSRWRGRWSMRRQTAARLLGKKETPSRYDATPFIFRGVANMGPAKSVGAHNRGSRHSSSLACVTSAEAGRLPRNFPSR